MGEKSGLTIGRLARRAKCSVASVRYYEEIGLLPAARRLEGGHRVYDAQDVQRAVFIRRCREFGFSIIRIRDLLEVSGGAPCSAARDIAQTHLDEIRSKVRELAALEASLARFVGDCAAGCGDSAARDCSLFDDLATHDPTTAPDAPGCGSPKRGGGAASHERRRRPGGARDQISPERDR